MRTKELQKRNAFTENQVANFSTDIDIQAPIEEVWSVLADVGSISLWNTGNVDSFNTSDVTRGVGATRHCDLGGKNYLAEEVVDWEHCERLTMRITGTNLPFKRADIHFELTGNNGTTNVIVSPDYELKYGVLGRVMDRLHVRGTYVKGMNNLLLGLKNYVEDRSEQAAIVNPTAGP